MAAVEVLEITPTPGTAIDPDEVLQVDVRSLTALVRVILTVEFAGFQFREVVFDGDPAVANPAVGYEKLYSPGGTVDSVVDGAFFRFRFRFRRFPLWPNSPELVVIAYNLDGEEA